jgi:polyribonucleotide 5'-hydroxyl-kinase
MDGSSAKKEGSRTIRLEKEHELRFEVDFESSVTIKLLDGTAECFGTELALQREYSFSSTKGAIFTWHGATIEIIGNCHSYAANETPMVMYANVHNAIEEERMRAAATGGQGPRVMLVGPTDSGKTSLSKLFLSYGVRKGHQPTFVDLDIGQGSITVPGMAAAVAITQPIPIGQEEFSTNAPLAYFYGHVTPSENVKLYKMQIANLAQDINQKFQKNEAARTSGLIINTCGWVDGLGYELLLHSINTLQADIVLVIDHERLYSDLTQNYKASTPNVKVIKLAKSGGVVTRDPQYRRKSRTHRIKEYFYGVAGDLCPHSTVVDFKDIHVYKVGGGPSAPSGALPIGAQSTVDPVRLVEVAVAPELGHSILGVSHATKPEELLNSNMAGFLYVSEVDITRQRMTVLAPCPGNLPSKYLVLGSLKWLE